MAKPKKSRLAANGLTSFSLHVNDHVSAPAMSALAAERRSDPGVAALGVQPLEEADPESAARRYLLQALASPRIPQLTAPEVAGVESEFKGLGSEKIPLTGTTTVKFRQTFNKIPVYGSLITVELGDANELLGIESSLGEPTGVNPVAKISASDAVRAVKAYPGYKKDVSNAVPRLIYYYDMTTGKWRLCFLLEDVPVTAPKGKKCAAPTLMDYMVDAHTGKVIQEIPRTSTMAAASATGVDGLQKSRTFTVELSGTKKIMKDLALNVWTYDLQFKDPSSRPSPLPGAIINNPPQFSGSAVSAHANASVVSMFMRQQLRRNNIDGQGGAMVSTVNCVVQRESSKPNEWLNAYWNSRQMVYGQRTTSTGPLSLATGIEVVAHEMFHGVTERTSRLQYALQSGALNESYSDIFGMIIKNAGNADVNSWSWTIGDGFGRGGGPFRDMSKPRRFGQPDHMRNFVVLPNTEDDDWGGVHSNSGIHNKAAFNVLMAVDSAGAFVFTPTEAAAIFYLSLTQYLSRTSQFADSRRGVLSAARSLFRTAPPATLAQKITALENAFKKVGIV